MDESLESQRPKVRPKGKAARAILDYLDANDEALPDDIGQFEVNDAVTKAVDALYDAYAADGVVPTREAFAERCGEPSIGEAVRAMPEDPFARKAMSRKAVAAICAGCVAAVVIVGYGVALALGSGGTPDASPQTAVTGAAGSETGASVADTVRENCTANPNADTEAVEEEAAEATEATQEGSSAQIGSTGNTGGTGSTSFSSGGGSSTGGSSSGGNSGSAPSGGSSSSKPSHTHNWVAQTKTVHHDAEYKTVHHDAEYKTVHHDAVVEYRDICNNCGADITGNIDAHFKANILNGCGSFTSKPVTVQAAYDENVLVKDAWDETVLVKAAWDETVTTGYKCSGCGATK